MDASEVIARARFERDFWWMKWDDAAPDLQQKEMRCAKQDIRALRKAGYLLLTRQDQRFATVQDAFAAWDAEATSEGGPTLDDIVAAIRENRGH